MKRINILLILGGMICFGLGYMTSRTFRDSYGVNPRMYQEIDSLRMQLRSKDSTILDLSCQVDILEEEVSYWGQKYDSLNAVNNWP